MDPSAHDKALLERLNALKPSTVNLSSTSLSFTNHNEQPTDDITTRFRSLKSSTRNGVGKKDPDALIASIAETPDNEDVSPPSPTVEELLADLGPEEQWSIERDEGAKIRELMDEAKGVLASASHNPSERDGGEGEGATDVLREEKSRSERGGRWEEGRENEGDEEGKEDKEDKDDEEEAALQLQRILDELALESPSSGNPTLHDSPPPPPPPEARHSLPSTPRDLKSLPPNSVPLRLPSPPQTIPSNPNPKPTTPSQQKKEDETATWCIICLANAVVRCKGCDDDLYCWRCWMEGHVGERAGWEERGHRWEGVGGWRGRRIGVGIGRDGRS
ncbi:MAG: hypothetical protein Q9169_005626 [Polycauliona sp. 2 TL-2023]